jgi:hypothetical protein
LIKEEEEREKKDGKSSFLNLIEEDPYQSSPSITPTAIFSGRLK